MRLRISDRNVLCIDWDERSLRVVDASLSRSGVRIRSALHVRLAPGTDVRDPASLGDFIRRTLGEHRIRTRRAIVDIPRQDAVLNLLSLPDASADELAAMVHIQIAKELPFSKEQAVIDFAAAHEEGAGTYNVWVGAVRNSVMDHYRQVMATAGLRLERVGLRPYANLVAVTATAPVEGRTLMVDVGPSLAEITVIRDGRLVYSRAASVSVPVEGLRAGAGRAEAPSAPAAGDSTIPLADDFVAPPGPMDALLIEVSRTLEAYRAADPGSSIDRIVLAGTAGIDQQVADAFRNRFAVPATLYESPKSLLWRGGRGISAVPFSAVVGLALSNVAEGMETFDFLHPKEPEAGRRERARRVPIIAATVALFLTAAAVFAYNEVRRREAQIESYEAQASELKGDKERQERHKDFMEQWGDMVAWREQNVIWVDQLRRLVEVFPSNEDAYITKLECKAGKDGAEVVVELVAVDESKGSEFVERVKEVTQEVREEESRFGLPARFEGELDEGIVSAPLRAAFEEREVRLSEAAAVTGAEPGRRWLIVDKARRYVVTKDGTTLNAYRVKKVHLFDATPGTPVVNKDDPKYPVADKVTVELKPLGLDTMLKPLSTLEPTTTPAPAEEMARGPATAPAAGPDGKRSGTADRRERQ